MKNLHRNKMTFPLVEGAFGLTVLATACTPATPDYTPLSTTGTNTGSATEPSSGSTGPTSTGTPSGASTGASTDTNAAGSTTTTNPGAATDTNPGTAGADAGSTTDTNTGTTTDTNAGTAGADGGSTGTGSPTGAGTGQTTGAGTDTTTGGDGGAGTGCNWIQKADGTWGFDPAAPGKIVLFDGTQATFAMWHKENQPTVPIQWTLNADGTMTVVPSGTGMATEVQSDMKFENLCVHVEYQTPMYPSSVMGQQRGNSGVYLKSAYEMQILDSFGQPADINTCGAVYSIMKPLVVACLPNNPPLPWNIYEIEFKSSVWSNATPPVKTQNAEFIQCALNGQIVQRNVTLNPAGGFTQAGIPDAPGPQPLGLQDHLDLVSFRNVWVRIPQY